MDAPSLSQGYLNIPLEKGAILRLTPTEYASGIRRGKAYLRATRQAEREQALLAQQEADTLAWIDPEERVP